MFSKHTKQYTKNRKKGFTLLELVVSVFIFSVLAAIFVANFKRGAQNDSLRAGAAAVTSVLRKAQNFSQIGSQDIPASMTNNRGRFGVHFDSDEPTKYSLFLDFGNGAGGSPDGRYQSGEALPNAAYSLPVGVIIYSLSVKDAENIFDVVFLPPKPTILLNGTETSYTADIVLRQNFTQQDKTITINRLAGQISIK